jgi:hypothetical protein
MYVWLNHFDMKLFISENISGVAVESSSIDVVSGNETKL